MHHAAAPSANANVPATDAPTEIAITAVEESELAGGDITTDSATCDRCEVVVIELDTHDTTREPPALAFASTVPNRTIINSPSVTSISALSLVDTVHPPKSLQVPLPATEAAVRVGQTPR